ncbi:MAG: zinc-binding dehydrogenase [Ilumatobacteraceae bacterium]
MKALQIDKRLGRIGLARVLSAVAPTTAAKAGPLTLIRTDPPELPGPDWVRLKPRLSGICGSDLATVQGQAGTYFDAIVSFPFTLGHELVADTIPGGASSAGGLSRRVALIPVLHCAVRGISPVCTACATGDINRCERVAFGHIKPGLQTGYCCETGGGWSEGLVAHPLQLVDVPDDLGDDDAVMIEPTACATRAARAYAGGSVAIIGAGTVGLLTVAAIIGSGREAGHPPLVAAKYSAQKRTAIELGATVCTPGELPRMVRSQQHSLVAGDQLTGGVAQVFDCVGSSQSLQQALSVVAPGGEIVLVGMPSTVNVDLTGLWHREVRITGCYAYNRADFDTAIELVRRFRLGRLVSATYRLDEYDTAIAHAANAGPRDAIKIAFDMRDV